MRIEKAIEFFSEGSTKPFLALDNHSRKVVVKAMVRPTMGKILLNEYLAGNLANAIKLPWPQTKLGTLSSNVVGFLREKGFTVSSMDCVVIEFIEGLHSVPWPDPPNGQEVWNDSNSGLLPEANRRHLMKYFDDPSRQSAFYGRALFEVWLFMQDTKYDTLFSKEDRTPFFLDGSHAFEGSDWECEQMDYSHPKTFPMSAYLEGILADPRSYGEWFDRIERIADTCIHDFIDRIPDSWQITKEQRGFLLDLLVNQRRVFVETWKERIENQELMKQWTGKMPY
jgi:hypothetical protein